MSTPRRTGIVALLCRHRRWLTPGFAVVIGVAYLAAGLAGGEPRVAWAGFATMVVVAAAMVAAGRVSETAKGLLDGRDERINSLDRGATVFAGVVVILAILAMFIVEIARGEDGSPYAQLGAVAGVSYAGALLWLRWRR